MPKTPKIELSDDSIREIILKYFYNALTNSIGLESHKLKISKVYADLKKLSIERKPAVRNLRYLIETKWIIEEIKNITYATRTTESKTYRISKDGIDLFEGSSKFQKSDKSAGINMGNITNSIVNLGDDNYISYVFNENKDLAESLNKLGSQIRLSSEILDKQKIEYQAEINTINSQLMKSNPDKGIIQKSWDILKGVSTINSLITLFNHTIDLIKHFL